MERPTENRDRSDEERRQVETEAQFTGCAEPVVGWCRVCDQYHVPTLTVTSPDAHLIAWLEWNDRNGCYTPEEIEMEGLPPLTRADLITLIADQGGPDLTPPTLTINRP